MADLTAAITEAVREAVRQEIAAQDNTRLSSVLERLANHKASEEIQLWKPYSTKEAAKLLPVSRKAVYDIPEDQLKPTWVGPAKGRKCFLGIHILCYVAGLPPVDVKAIASEVREDFVNQAKKPHVVEGVGEGMRRII